jgi:hypothetical protein
MPDVLREAASAKPIDARRVSGDPQWLKHLTASKQVVRIADTEGGMSSRPRLLRRVAEFGTSPPHATLAGQQEARSPGGTSPYGTRL